MRKKCVVVSLGRNPDLSFKVHLHCLEIFVIAWNIIREGLEKWKRELSILLYLFGQLK